jgi:transcriptional regulator with XRE-family HTH domain
MAVQEAVNAPRFELCDRLRKARTFAGLTQEQLGERMGVGRRSITRYEDGTQTPRRSVVIAWAVTTGVPLEWIEGEMDDTPTGRYLTESVYSRDAEPLFRFFHAELATA